MALTGAWGLALFATDSGPIAEVWVWPGDPLTSRLIGSMLLTVAAVSLFGRTRADVAHVANAVGLTNGMGVAAAGLWSAPLGKPIPLAYVVVFAALALGSAFAARGEPEAGPDGAWPAWL